MITFPKNRPETYSPDDAPQISFLGKQVALTKFILYPRIRQTKHSPEEPPFLEILEAYAEDDKGEWVKCSEDFVEKLMEDEEAYDAAFDKASHDPYEDGYFPDEGDYYSQF